ncbi:MAG: tRNA adenosine(34) deaminase TadA [Eubacteriales bacterium]|nr:tRNA adenosine(34) deaminase TadA [Eubacteriales bacterium]
MDYNFFMQEALKEAEKAYNINEIPIGCVIEYKGEIIARGYNQRNVKNNVLCHAEIIAINNACEKFKDWRLEGSTLYVTVEPCAMCAGAILQSRIDKVVFGVFNSKGGCCGSILNILNDERFNHKAEIISGILEEDCKKIMKDFFKNIRKNK